MGKLLVKVTYTSLPQTKLELKMNYIWTIQMLSDISTMSMCLANNVSMQLAKKKFSSLIIKQASGQ